MSSPQNFLKDRLVHHQGDQQVTFTEAQNTPLQTIRSEVGRALFSLRNQHGFTYEEIASEVARLTGVTISLGSLHNWENTKINVVAIPQKEFMAALETITKLRPRMEKGYWMEKQEAKETVSNWLKCLEINQIAEITGLPKTTLYSLLTGRYRAERLKMETAETKVSFAVGNMEI